MFRTVGDQPSLWESILPEELLRLPAELARLDALLDDPVFFAPFAPFFAPFYGAGHGQGCARSGGAQAWTAGPRPGVQALTAR